MTIPNGSRKRLVAALGGKASKGGTHLGEGDGTVPGNEVNPTVGSGLQDVRTVLEEKAVEVVENHEGGTSSEVGCLRAEGTRSGQPRCAPGVDSFTAKTTQGRSLDKPKRGKERREPFTAGPATSARMAQRSEGQPGRIDVLPGTDEMVLEDGWKNRNGTDPAGATGRPRKAQPSRRAAAKADEPRHLFSRRPVSLRRHPARPRHRKVSRWTLTNQRTSQPVGLPVPALRSGGRGAKDAPEREDPER